MKVEGGVFEMRKGTSGGQRGTRKDNGGV
jgi:hypothetical protein